MVVEELASFRAALRQLLGEASAPREAFIALFEAYRFPAVDRALRARKRRCRIPTKVLADWPLEERWITHRVGSWDCTEFEYREQQLQWCPHLNTLILYIKIWNERGPVGRQAIPRRRDVWYRLLTVEEAVDHLLVGRDTATVPAGPAWEDGV
jgi:hypothetical protein